MNLEQKLHNLCGRISTACCEWIDASEDDVVHGMESAIYATKELVEAGMGHLVEITAYATANGKGDVQDATAYLGALMSHAQTIEDESEISDEQADQLKAEGLISKSEEHESGIDHLEKCLNLGN